MRGPDRAWEWSCNCFRLIQLADLVADVREWTFDHRDDEWERTIEHKVCHHCRQPEAAEKQGKKLGYMLPVGQPCWL